MKFIQIAGEIHGASFCTSAKGMNSKGFHFIHAHQKNKTPKPGTPPPAWKGGCPGQNKAFLIHTFHELKIFLEFLWTEKPSVMALNY